MDAEELARAVTLGHSIARLRGKKGMSQYGLADQIGESQSTISRVEKGLLWPDLNKLVKICRVLGVPHLGFISGMEEAMKVSMASISAAIGADLGDSCWQRALDIGGEQALSGICLFGVEVAARRAEASPAESSK